VRCGTTMGRARVASVTAMSSLTRPRGPLPRRVYWVRRILVLGTALALVVGIGTLLNLGSDASSDKSDPAAVQVATHESTTPGADPTTKKTKHHKPKTRKPTKPPLPEPSGPCEPGDIVISPVVPEAFGGGDVRIRLELSTRISDACTWELSKDSLTFKISSGTDNIWSSLDCPAQVPTRSLVLRRETPIWTAITWNSRRSEPGCPTSTLWALPGWYHVAVAAFDGEPADVQFRLRRPSADESASPDAGSGKPGDKPSGDKSGDKNGDKNRGSDKPSSKPSPNTND